MSPTARTLKWLRDNGFVADVVERWIPRANIRKDLFGFIDIVALAPWNEILGIQCTSMSNVSKRTLKICGLIQFTRWIQCHGSVYVVGWAKKGARGERKVWVPAWKRMCPDGPVEVLSPSEGLPPRE